MKKINGIQFEAVDKENFKINQLISFLENLEELNLPDDLHTKDKYGNTPLHYLAEYDNYENENMNENENLFNLEEASKIFNINYNIKDNLGNTPLHIATIYDNFKFIITSLDNGADVNAENNKGYSPLQMTDDEITAWCLIINGADINKAIRQSKKEGDEITVDFLNQFKKAVTQIKKSQKEGSFMENILFANDETEPTQFIINILNQKTK